VMYTAWLIDKSSTAQVRQYVAATKVLAAEILTDINLKAAHVHGALGASNAMSFGGGGGSMGVVDGPTEVHKVTIAKQVLKQYQPHKAGWPSQSRPRRLVAARHRFEEMVQERFDDAEMRGSFGAMLQSSEVPDDLMREMEDYLEAILGANL